MPRVGFEPMIPMFEKAKTFHALHRAAAVIPPINIVGVKWQKDEAR
jgi:hypothetical protein